MRKADLIPKSKRSKNISFLVKTNAQHSIHEVIGPNFNLKWKLRGIQFGIKRLKS